MALNVRLLNGFGPDMLAPLNETLRQLDNRQLSLDENIQDLISDLPDLLSNILINTANIQTGAVTTTQILDGTITSADLSVALRQELLPPKLYPFVSDGTAATTSSASFVTWDGQGGFAGALDATNQARLQVDFSELAADMDLEIEFFGDFSLGAAGRRAEVELYNDTDGTQAVLYQRTWPGTAGTNQWLRGGETTLADSGLQTGTQPKDLHIRARVVDNIADSVTILQARLILTAHDIA